LAAEKVDFFRRFGAEAIVSPLLRQLSAMGIHVLN